MKNICVLGTGYVGLVTGVCFADLGNRVVCVDVDPQKVAMLCAGKSPIYEPGLEELLERNVRAERLSFTESYATGLANADFVFITVGTPMGEDGAADLRYVKEAAHGIGEALQKPVIIIDKSTVPVGTGDVVSEIVASHVSSDLPFAVVSNPEFLREGSAVSDFFKPDRIVLGSMNREAAEKVAELHAPLDTKIIITDLRTAEMIKYASNAFLATRISFVNEIAQICERLGADVKEVARGMGADKRIGPHFLDAGIGYGGSCFEPTEKIFLVNDSAVTKASFEQFFANIANETFKSAEIAVKKPLNQQVLAFDLTTGLPIVAQIETLTKRAYSGPMLTFQTANGQKLCVTADHPVVLQTAQGFKIVAAAMVKPEDQLLMLPALADQQADSGLKQADLLAQRYVIQKVLKISPDHVEKDVYSLETSSETVITTTGIICHNCFPKDVLALHHMAASAGCHPQLLQAVMEINHDARRRFVIKVKGLVGDLAGKVIGVLGLSFKPNTDDLREAPSLDIIQALQAEGASVKAYDPVSMEGAAEVLPKVTFCATAYDVAKGADALLIITEWNEFKQLNWQKIQDFMNHPIVVDGRNLYDPQEMAAKGFTYVGVGRGIPPALAQKI